MVIIIACRTISFINYLFQFILESVTAFLHISPCALYFNVYILISFNEGLASKLKTDDFLHFSLTPERIKITLKLIYIYIYIYWGTIYIFKRIHSIVIKRHNPILNDTPL